MARKPVPAEFVLFGTIRVPWTCANPGPRITADSDHRAPAVERRGSALAPMQGESHACTPITQQAACVDVAG
jgi:hypothetical protein